MFLSLVLIPGLISLVNIPNVLDTKIELDFIKFISSKVFRCIFYFYNFNKKN